jgi:hypothetical protein
LENWGGRHDRESSSGRNVRVKAAREDQSADRKKVRFPPPKAWDPEAKWTQDCVMAQYCGEKHSPARCEVFKKPTPQQRLKKIEERGLCKLCYGHLQGRDCWSLGKVPNCDVNGCGAPHHPILHGAIVAGRVMIIRGAGEERAQTHLCQEDVRVEVAGKTPACTRSMIRALRSPSSTMLPQRKLERMRQPTSTVAGLKADARWSASITWCRLLTETTEYGS